MRSGSGRAIEICIASLRGSGTAEARSRLRSARSVVSGWRELDLERSSPCSSTKAADNTDPSRRPRWTRTSGDPSAALSSAGESVAASACTRCTLAQPVPLDLASGARQHPVGVIGSDHGPGRSHALDEMPEVLARATGHVEHALARLETRSPSGAGSRPDRALPRPSSKHRVPREGRLKLVAGTVSNLRPAGMSFAGAGRMTAA